VIGIGLSLAMCVRGQFFYDDRDEFGFRVS